MKTAFRLYYVQSTTLQKVRTCSLNVDTITRVRSLCGPYRWSLHRPFRVSAGSPPLTVSWSTRLSGQGVAFNVRFLLAIFKYRFGKY
jgi:hypothetical protein